MVSGASQAEVFREEEYDEEKRMQSVRLRDNACFRADRVGRG